MPNVLTQRAGPFPVWGWMVMGAGGLVLFSYYKKHQQTAQQQNQAQQQAQIAAQQAASTAAAAPYQPYTVPYIASSNTYGNGYTPAPQVRHQGQPGGMAPSQQWGGGSFGQGMQGGWGGGSSPDNDNTTAQQTQAAPNTYTIKSGDTFYGLSQSKGIPLNTILAANPGVDPTKLQPGQTVNL